MRKKGTGFDEKRGADEPGRTEGRETVIRKCYVGKEPIFNKRGKNKNLIPMNNDKNSGNSNNNNKNNKDWL